MEESQSPGACVLSHVLLLMEKPTLLFDAITSELLTMDDDLIRPLVPQIITIASAALLLPNDEHSAKAHEIIFNLSEAVGPEAISNALKPLIGDADEQVRHKASAVIAISSQAIGISAIQQLLEDACGNKESWQARHTGVIAVERVASLLGKRASPHLAPLAEMVSPNLSHKEPTVKRVAASSLAALAEAADRDGHGHVFDRVFSPLMKSIWKGVHSPEHDAFMVSSWAVVQLMDDKRFAGLYCCDALIRDVNCYGGRRGDIAIRMLGFCLEIGDEMVDAELQRLVGRCFFKSFWAIGQDAGDGLKVDDYRLLANATAKVLRRLGIDATLALVGKQLSNHVEPYVRMMVEEAVVKIHTAYTLSSAQHLEEALHSIHCILSLPRTAILNSPVSDV